MNYLLLKNARHIYAHIYEHVIAARLTEYIIHNKLLRILDVNFWASAEDDNIIFDITEGLRKPMNMLSRAVIEENETLKAVETISCESQRHYRIVDGRMLVDKMNTINSQDWSDVNTMSAKKTAYEEDVHHCESLEFQKATPSDFSHFMFLYTLPEKYDKLRPVAAYVFQVIALSQIDLFYANHACFDGGDEWNSWGKYTGYLHYLVFHKNIISEKELILEHTNNLKEIVEEHGLHNKLIKYLRSTKIEEMYFTPGTINEYSGYIVGREGWRQLATRENVATILNNMKIEIKEINETHN